MKLPHPKSPRPLFAGEEGARRVSGGKVRASPRSPHNRTTHHPRASSHAVRATSASLSACCPPSASTINLHPKHAKSAKNGPTGTCLRNFTPTARFRNKPQSRASACVCPRRNARARSTMADTISRSRTSHGTISRASKYADSRLLPHPHLPTADAEGPFLSREEREKRYLPKIPRPRLRVCWLLKLRRKGARRVSGGKVRAAPLQPNAKFHVMARQRSVG
jgi:hypothetical protein